LGQECDGYSRKRVRTVMNEREVMQVCKGGQQVVG